jgi:hypothetical protein
MLLKKCGAPVRIPLLESERATSPAQKILRAPYDQRYWMEPAKCLEPPRLGVYQQVAIHFIACRRRWKR